MFRLDLDRMRVLFTIDERDLALALVATEGHCVVDEHGTRAEFAIAPVFGIESRPRQLRGPRIVEPMQDSPGVWSYRIKRAREVAA